LHNFLLVLCKAFFIKYSSYENKLQEPALILFLICICHFIGCSGEKKPMYCVCRKQQSAGTVRKWKKSENHLPKEIFHWQQVDDGTADIVFLEDKEDLATEGFQYSKEGK
jgi:hypothetical protein